MSWLHCYELGGGDLVSLSPSLLIYKMGAAASPRRGALRIYPFIHRQPLGWLHVWATVNRVSRAWHQGQGIL